MEHYYVKNPKTKSKLVERKIKIENDLFTFFTDNSVFSKKSLDFGTRTLIESINVEQVKGSVLDLGCGYGPIGIYISKKTDIVVDMIDINDRGLKLAVKNSLINNVKTNVYYSDGFEKVEKKYNLIITNPPIRIGNKKLYSMLIDAKNYLVDTGELRIVIHKDQGAKTLAKELSNYYSVKVINKNKGFYVISAINH